VKNRFLGTAPADDVIGEEWNKGIDYNLKSRIPFTVACILILVRNGQLG
jgi:hypothetical protein